MSKSFHMNLGLVSKSKNVNTLPDKKGTRVQQDCYLKENNGNFQVKGKNRQIQAFIQQLSCFN